jgi:dUTP pyrophosphatase
MPGETMIVSTGLAVQLDRGTELQVRPRSGLSAKTKIRVGNSPGTIDEDYRGEIKIILDNIGHLPYTIYFGDRIAQGVICPVIRANFEVVDELTDTERGAGGLGSTGV